MDIPQQPVPSTKTAGEVAGTPPAAEEAETYELHQVSTGQSGLPCNKDGEYPTRSTTLPMQEHHAHFDLPPGEPKEAEESMQLPVVDIEHTPVDDDPREWSHRKKVSSCGREDERQYLNIWCHQTIILAMISIASISPTMGASIYNPAFDELREELRATDNQLALSISIFILLQGGFPVGALTVYLPLSQIGELTSRHLSQCGRPLQRSQGER